MVSARTEHEFLSEIGLSSHNLRSYVGSNWQGKRPVVSTLNPANNQPIAEVVEASLEDYESGLKACEEAAPNLFENGEWIASSDVSGTVRIWGTHNDHVLRSLL